MRVVDVIQPPFEAGDHVTLDETDRHRRRIQLTSNKGHSFLVDFPEARLLKHGEGLQLEDGTIIEVRAEAEALYKLTAHNGRALTTLAWQLGNRHLPAEIHPEHIIIRQDHVIKEMVIGLGAHVEEFCGPFNPEMGAYAGHNHHHGDNDGHAH